MMNEEAKQEIMQRRKYNHSLELTGYFNFTLTTKKKFPFVKIDDRLVLLLQDIIEAQGFRLTISFLHQRPGKPQLLTSYTTVNVIALHFSSCLRFLNSK